MVLLNRIDCEPMQQKAQTVSERKSNINVSSPSDASVVSCMEDNLNYTYAISCKGGILITIIMIFSKIFNSHIMYLGPIKTNQTSGEVQCGICSIIRFYKSIAKTKKYGAYSCDSCRKFIARSIENQNTINRCNNEKGNIIDYIY